MTAPGRPLSLASLTALHVPPPQLVHHAAAAGFSLVGALRLIPASDGTGADLLRDAALRRQTADALEHTGLRVLDVEVFRVRPGTAAAEAEPLLAVGAELGARFLLTAVEDPEPARRAEVVAELCDLARAGGTPADLDTVPPGRLPYVQLCDAASAEPAGTDPAGLRRAVEEAVGHRLPPGEGVLPLPDVLRRLPADAAVSLEVPNPAARADPAGWIRRIAAAAHRLLSGGP